MKCLLFILICLFIATHSQAQIPEGETVAKFSLRELAGTDGATSYLMASSPHNPHVKIGVDGPSDPNNELSAPLTVAYDGTDTLQLRWLTWSYLVRSTNFTGHLTTHHFAIVGELATENVSQGSYLEMQSTFASPGAGYPEETAAARTTDADGLAAHLDGTTNWRKFWIPLDATSKKTQVERVEAYLRLTGRGTVRLRNVRLMQYPDLAAKVSTNSTPDPTADKWMYRFGWPDGFANQPHPSMEVDPNTWSFSLKYWGEKPADLEVQRVELNVLSTLETNQFAVEGHLQYDKVTPGSYLEMWTIFEPEKPGDPPLAYCTRTLADSGPLQTLSGTSESRAFQIPFDITGAKTHLKRILVRLHLAGGYGTTVTINDANLSQFPNGYFPAGVASIQTLAPTAPPPLANFEATDARAPAPWSLDGKSFLVGAVVSLGLAAAISAIRILGRLWRKQKAEKEMRRIASLDT